MGNPSCFHIKHGANPHTRNRLGIKKKVDSIKAIDQWHALKDALQSYRVQIHVIKAHEDMPGLVFPANAGYVPLLDEGIPLSKRQFILSTLNKARRPEEGVYADFIEKLGLKVHRISRQFEGQADLIRWGEQFLYTYGKMVEPHFAARLGIPPWKRFYGFRSDQQALNELARWSPLEKTISLELVDEDFYHGDTVLCSFGLKREYLMVYPNGLSVHSMKALQNPNIIWLSRADAYAFAANSFQVVDRGQCILFMPMGISEVLRQQIEEKGIEVVLIDVSEFLEKGGGAIKCMIGDLGAWESENHNSESQLSLHW